MKKEIVKFLLLAILAIGSAPATAALWQWSLTPANNGNADPSINWAVGMAPSAVDPSARAMMARTAEWRDDVSGALTLGGTSTAYTVLTNQSVGGNGICGAGTVPTNGQMIAVTPNLSNGTAPTIAVDGCTAAPIQSSTGTPVPAATLIAGTPYNMKYSTTNTAWMLANFYGNSGVPLGSLTPYTATTAPNSNFILPAGQCISTITYATYWALLGSPVPGGCAVNQFAVIDVRGRTPVALDNLNGSAANRLTSAATGCGTAMTSIGATCATGTESKTLGVTALPAHTHSGNTGTESASHSHVQSGFTITSISFNYANGGTQGGQAVASQSTGTESATHTHGFTTDNGTGSGGVHATVDPNIAVVYLLRVI